MDIIIAKDQYQFGKEEGNALQKWEYTILDIENVFYTSQANDIIIERLNELGRDGWEVVGYATFEVHRLLLKRPIE